MTETGYTKTIKPVRDWSQRIWRLMFTQQVEIARGRVEGAQSVAVTGTLTTSGAVTDILAFPGSTVKDPSVAPAGGVQMTCWQHFQPARSSGFASRQTRRQPHRLASMGGSKMSIDRAQKLGGEGRVGDRLPYSVFSTTPPYEPADGTRRGDLLAQGRTSGVLADFAPSSNFCPPVKRI